jgi:hypothetical protein
VLGICHAVDEAFSALGPYIELITATMAAHETRREGDVEVSQIGSVRTRIRDSFC